MGPPVLMGILNVTPDSFSDGGLYANVADAVETGIKMIADGADLIDVGGESTRPGAIPVSVGEELARVLPIVEGLAAANVVVSIDTRHFEVAEEALAAGATMVNDVSGLSDPQMREVCAAANCQVCIMHMQGEPATMQDAPLYEDVVREVRDFLLDSASLAIEAGVARTNIWIDPGIGFGKTVDQNLSLLRHLSSFVETGFPVLLGVSRKGFISRLSSRRSLVDARLPGTLALQTLAQAAGVQMIRAHDIVAVRQAIDVAHAVLRGHA